jgi:hypothetical protein
MCLPVAPPPDHLRSGAVSDAVDYTIFRFLTSLIIDKTKAVGHKIWVFINKDKYYAKSYINENKKVILAVYGQNRDCFNSNVADPSLTGPKCPGRRPIFSFPSWGFLRGWQPLGKLFSPGSRLHTTKIGRTSIPEMTQKEEPHTGYQINLRSGAKVWNNFTSISP